jgi:hypothetical protein
VKAFLYSTQDFFETTGAPPWAGGLFDGLISLPVTTGPISSVALRALARTVQHEVTHAYLYAFCGDTLPSWIGEGLAMQYEGRTKNASLFELKKIFGNQASGVTTAGLGENFANFNPKEVGRLYAQSQLLVSYLAKEGSGSGNLSSGNSSWRNIVTRVCQGRETLHEVLLSEFASGSAEEIWRNKEAKMMGGWVP